MRLVLVFRFLEEDKLIPAIISLSSRDGSEWERWCARLCFPVQRSTLRPTKYNMYTRWVIPSENNVISITSSLGEDRGSQIVYCNDRKRNYSIRGDFGKTLCSFLMYLYLSILSVLVYFPYHGSRSLRSTAAA